MLTKAELNIKINKLELIVKELRGDSHKCKVTKYPGMGRGVVAENDISKGDVFLTCPVLKLSPGDEYFTQKTILRYYVFSGESDMSPYSYLALGLGSLFNSSSKKDNTEWVVNENKEIITFKATRDISTGEQIFIDYGWE